MQDAHASAGLHHRLAPALRLRLSGMMFLEYFVWGSWFVTLGTYLIKTRQFSAPDVGLAYGTSALGALVAPLLVGMVADRFFATERILAVLHLAGGGLLYWASTQTEFSAVYLGLLLHFLCFMPTLALCNSLSFHQLTDPGKQFPGIRVLGTIGWIVAGIAIGQLKIDDSALPMRIGAAASVMMAFYCLLLLPHTPPDKTSHRTVASLLGLDALKLMRNLPFAVFVIGSLLICIPLQFYYTWTNAFLNEIGVGKVAEPSALQSALGAIGLGDPASLMTLGQMSEIFFMLVMPLCFARLGVKAMLLVGMAAWTLRYVLFAYGDPGAGFPLLVGGIVLHGICYDFFFVTGQIYVDRQAPPEIRAAAQGFIALVTLGLGGLIGMTLSGLVVGHYAGASPELPHDWRSIWIVPAVGAGAVMMLFALLFRERSGAHDGGRP